LQYITAAFQFHSKLFYFVLQE